MENSMMSRFCLTVYFTGVEALKDDYH